MAQPEILDGLLGVSSRDSEDAVGVEGCIGCGDGVSAFPSGGVWKGGHALHRFFKIFLAFKTTDFL